MTRLKNSFWVAAAMLFSVSGRARAKDWDRDDRGRHWHHYRHEGRAGHDRDDD